MHGYIIFVLCRHRGWLARRLSYVLFVLERDVQKDMFARNVVDNVLNNCRYHKAIWERNRWNEKCLFLRTMIHCIIALVWNALLWK